MGRALHILPRGDTSEAHRTIFTPLESQGFPPLPFLSAPERSLCSGRWVGDALCLAGGCRGVRELEAVFLPLQPDRTGQHLHLVQLPPHTVVFSAPAFAAVPGGIFRPGRVRHPCCDALQGLFFCFCHLHAGSSLWPLRPAGCRRVLWIGGAVFHPHPVFGGGVEHGAGQQHCLRATEIRRSQPAPERMFGGGWSHSGYYCPSMWLKKDRNKKGYYQLWIC